MSFVSDKIISDGLTFDDVLLVPDYSEVLPKDVSIKIASGMTESYPLNITITREAPNYSR